MCTSCVPQMLASGRIPIHLRPKKNCVSGYSTVPSFSTDPNFFVLFLEDSVGFFHSDILFPNQPHVKILNKI